MVKEEFQTVLIKALKPAPRATPLVDRGAFSAFLGQACAGAMTAMFALDMEKNGNYTNVLHANLARYLNGCWMNLMREDDVFVTDSFKAMNHRSPVCLIHMLFRVGTASLPNEPIMVGISNPNASVQERANAVRPIHQHVAKENIAGVLGKMDLNHECTGKTIAEERAEWVKKENPTEGVFTIE